MRKFSGGREDRQYAVAIAAAWGLSLVNSLYMRQMPSDIFPWKSAALPWHLEYVFQAMFYMFLGYVFCHRFEKWFDRHNTLKVRISVCGIYLLSVFVPYFAKVEMPAMFDILFGYVISILGIAAVVLVAKRVKTNRYINFVGQNTLIYFALHGKVYSVIQAVLKRFVGGFYAAVLGNVYASSVFCLVFSLVLSVVLIIPAYIINSWFPFIMGRRKVRVISK